MRDALKNPVMGRAEKEGVMPRERFDGLREATNEMVMLNLDIGWGRGLEEIQIGLVLPDPQTDSDPQSLYEMMSRWSPEDRDVHQSLWFTSRSWSQVNNMIHKLKVARDSAFGRPSR